MMSHRGRAASLVLLVACGGGDKHVKQAKPKPAATPPPAETDASREANRKAARTAIVPEGANCLPPALKAANAPRLELAGVGADALLCAVDAEDLGPVGCWKVDLRNMAEGTVPLVYQAAAPQPGHSVTAKLHDGCAWGFCAPGKPASGAAELSWNADSSKVAMLAGSDVHLFDGGSKKHLSTFGIAGDKGVTGTATAVHFVGESIVVEGGKDGNAWVFKLDGTGAGVINALGGKEPKPLAMRQGSFSVLDATKVGLADHGMDTFTVYELESGKRTKAVKKPVKLACKPAEIDAYWAEPDKAGDKAGDKVSDKCKDSLAKASGPWVGATAVMGAKNLLFVLRGERLGELAVVDPRTLVETKKALKMPWCGAEASTSLPAHNAPAAAAASGSEPGRASASGAARSAAAKDDSGEGAQPAKKRAPVKKGGDPEDGGE